MGLPPPPAAAGLELSLVQDAAAPAAAPTAMEDLEVAVQRAERGDRAAQYQLAMRYRQDGADHDDNRAYKWFCQAAEHRHPDAVQQLAVMVEQGLGTRADPVLAQALFLHARHCGATGVELAPRDGLDIAQVARLATQLREGSLLDALAAWRRAQARGDSALPKPGLRPPPPAAIEATPEPPRPARPPGLGLLGGLALALGALALPAAAALRGLLDQPWPGVMALAAAGALLAAHGAWRGMQVLKPGSSRAVVVAAAAAVPGLGSAVCLWLGLHLLRTAKARASASAD